MIFVIKIGENSPIMFSSQIRVLPLFISYILAINLDNNNLPLGYFNIHWSRMPCKYAGSNPSCNSIPTSSTTDNVATFNLMDQNFEMMPSTSAMNAEMGPSTSAMNAQYAPALRKAPSWEDPELSQQESANVMRILEKYYKPVQPVNRGNADYMTTFNVTTVLTHGDCNKELMKKECYTWYDKPIYQHLVSESWLLEELKTKPLHQVLCPSCFKRIDLVCVVEYFKKVVIFESTDYVDANPNNLPTKYTLATKLLEKLIADIEENVLALSLGIANVKGLQKLQAYLNKLVADEMTSFVRNSDYIDSNDSSFNVGAGYVIKKANDHPRITDPQVVTRIKNLNNIISLVITKMSNYEDVDDTSVCADDFAGCEDDSTPGPSSEKKRKVDDDDETDTTKMVNIAVLYKKSLRFPGFIASEYDLINYIELLYDKRMNTNRIYFANAKILSLLSNPKIPIGIIMPYLTPFNVGTIKYKKQPIIATYIAEYREDYKSIETSEELVLEALVYSKAPISTRARGELILPFLGRNEISFDRILSFIFRCTEYCDLEAKDASSTKTLCDICNYIRSHYTKCGTLRLEDFLKLGDLLRKYSMLNLENNDLSDIRNRYLFAKASAKVNASVNDLVDDLSDEITEKIREMEANRRHVTLDGLFSAIQYRRMKPLGNKFFKLFFSAFENHDLKFLYLSEMVPYQIVQHDRFYASLTSDFKDLPNLQILCSFSLLSDLIKNLLILRGILACNFTDTSALAYNLKADMEIYENHMKAYIDSFKKQLYAQGTVAEDAKVLLGFLCYYNLLLEAFTLPIEYECGKSKIDLSLSETSNAALPKDRKASSSSIPAVTYETIFKSLCQRLVNYSISMHCDLYCVVPRADGSQCHVPIQYDGYVPIPAHCNILSPAISSVFSYLDNKDLCHLYRDCFENNVAYSRILKEACLEHNINSRRRMLVIQIRAGNAIAQPYDKEMLEKYLNRVIAEIESTGCVNPSRMHYLNADCADQFATNENSLNQLERIRVKVREILDNIVQLGYDVHRDRELFYGKICPLIAGKMVGLALPFARSSFNLAAGVENDCAALEIFTFNMILEPAPINLK